MLYQRKISPSDLLQAKLELQLQHGRYALLGTQAVGVGSVMALVWFQVEQAKLLFWALAMMLLLLIQSLRMSSALTHELHRNSTRAVYLELILGALSTGAAWSLTVLWLDRLLVDEFFYLLILIVTIVSVVTIAVTSVIREIYLALLFSSLIPIAGWMGWHFDVRPFNLMLTAMLTALAMLLGLVSGWMSGAFGDVVESGLERAAMTKDFAELSESLRLRNVQLQEARKQLADIATIDELTGLRNRRGGNQVFATEISRAKRAGISLAVIMLDVDHFKLYNDTYGHPAGDVVLQRVAEVLLSVTGRAGELAVRMGGEEFMLILPGSTQGDALNAAGMVKKRIMALAIEHSSSPTAPVVTVSQGVVACIPRLRTETHDLIEAADKALYQSKNAGRNSITLSAYAA